jgi:uncharacterized protein involved in exopolysaccharide biosynthesis
MRRNEKSWTELDELLEPFLPDVPVDGATVNTELRNRLVKLEQQMMSQYTAMAAYATIAKQNTDTVRAEARADLDRSQATLIGLLEKLRNDVNVRLDSLDRRSAEGTSGDARLARLEQQLGTATTSLHQFLRENQELRTQLAELVEHKMRTEGWLVSSGSADELSLR